MKDSANMKVHCLELFKKKHNLYGSEALCLFQEFNVPDYIDSHYDEFLDLEVGFIVENISDYIAQHN